MDLVCRLQLVQVLIQIDDQQNIVAVQHQQVLHQCRLRCQRRWWCRQRLLRQPAFRQFENLMVELRIEDLYTVRTCNVSGEGGQADTLDLQA